MQPLMEKERLQLKLLAKKNYAPSLKTRAKNAARALFSPFKRPYDLLWGRMYPRQKYIAGTALGYAAASAAAIAFLSPWAAVPIVLVFGAVPFSTVKDSERLETRDDFVTDAVASALAAVTLSGLLMSVSYWDWTDHSKRAHEENLSALHQTFKKAQGREKGSTFPVDMQNILCEAEIVKANKVKRAPEPQLAERYRSPRDCGCENKSDTFEIVVKDAPHKTFWTGSIERTPLRVEIQSPGTYRELPPEVR